MVYSPKIRVFHKARKTQHQNFEFVPKPGEIKQKPPKNPLSFFPSASTAAAYIFTDLTYTTTINISNLVH
jgi:hypothetical protein